MEKEPYTSSKASYHQRFVNDGKAETLVATDYKDPPTIVEVHAEGLSVDEAKKVADNSNFGESAGVVRRLTPLECERLQGFPDGWTDIGDWVDTNGKSRKTSDTMRYKALGNSIATPYWFYLLRRISAQYERPATLGSMFSGIGGFDLCWARCNGTDSVRWSSEIEEFPMAVMRKHFGTGDVPGDANKYL